VNVFDQAKEEIAEMLDLAVWIAGYDAAVMAGKEPKPEIRQIRKDRDVRYWRLREKYLGDG